MTDHHVEVFIGDDGLNGWQCFTCGEEQVQVRGWVTAEELAEAHRATSGGAA